MVKLEDLQMSIKQHLQSLWQVLQGRNTVFFSTHVLDVAEKLCDRVGIINKGKLIFIGTYDELKAKFAEDGSLEKLFLELTENE